MRLCGRSRMAWAATARWCCTRWMANKWRAMLSNWDRGLGELSEEDLRAKARFARGREQQSLAKVLGRNPKAAREWRARRRVVEEELERRVRRQDALVAETVGLPELVVDLTGVAIQDWSQLWDALSEPCALPSWFGRNLDAWWDTIQARHISTVVDRHYLVIELGEDDFFRTGDGARFVRTTNESDFARATVA